MSGHFHSVSVHFARFYCNNSSEKCRIFTFKFCCCRHDKIQCDHMIALDLLILQYKNLWLSALLLINTYNLFTVFLTILLVHSLLLLICMSWTIKWFFVLHFFSETSSNGCRPTFTAGVSWWSATVEGCRVQESPVEGLSWLRETHSQWEGIPIGNGPRKNWMFELYALAMT